MQIRGVGYRRNPVELMLDWAAVARKLGRVPTEHDYARHGRHSSSSFVGRWRAWNSVPQAFIEFAKERQQVHSEWADVLAMAAERQNHGNPPISQMDGQPPPRIAMRQRKQPRFHDGRTIYGPLLALPGLAHEPTDETGVIFLFGILAHRLGFTVLHTQSGFPDCEALREIKAGRSQRVHIEFEYESRNFHRHRHRAAGCDMIVCWRHNWPQCPAGLEVLELSQVVRKM